MASKDHVSMINRDRAMLRVDRTRRRFRILAGIGSIPAIAALCLEYGFDRPPVSVALLHVVEAVAVATYLTFVIATIVTASSWWEGVRRHWIEVGFVLAGATLLVGIEEFERTRLLALTAGYVIAAQVLIVMRVAIGAVRLNLQLSRQALRPARLLLGTFLAVIFLGGCLLSLPKAVTPDVRAQSDQTPTQRVVDSFFTSVSATCVTGLVVYDTGSDFTRFGQVVILLLIQLGGLGIMIFSTVFSLLAGMHLSLRQSLVLQDELSHRTIGQMGNMVRFIVISTLVLEALGAAALYPAFASRASSTGAACFGAVFHAVSAFCNAGFALQTDSLIPFRGGACLYTSVMPLIVLGGLGFPVLKDIAMTIRARTGQPPDPRAPIMEAIWRTRPHGPRYTVSLHSKLVLITSAALIAVPTLLFVLFESPATVRSDHHRGGPPPARLAATIDSPVQNSLSGSPPGGRPSTAVVMRDLPLLQRLDAALFLSVTARTAGFNTVAMDERSLSDASHFLLAVLMFIGGSPASTAGGIKTVTLAVLVLGVWRTLRGRNRVQAFHRSINERTVARAAALVVVMFLLATLCVLALSYTQQVSVREALFESVSALGTVGLSTGLTPRLTVPGRFIIMLAMFVGRLGPLTLLIALAGAPAAGKYEYPVETVAIG